MKKKALIKDFYMEIRKSMGRFLSIFFIVALGVSLFSGIRATEPDMRLSGDAYVDENQLMDIRIVSTMGLTMKDVEAIRRLPAIEAAEGAYSIDALCKVKDNMAVLHVMSYLDNMNAITIEEGRLPRGTDECLVDHDFLKSSGYKIGDTIVLESGTEANLKDTLEKTEYRIVGSGTSPLYFSLDRGSSTIGNGSVSGFLVVNPETFVLDVYTEIFAFVKGAKEALAFTKAYDDIVKKAIEQIQMIQDVRCEVRKNDLAQNAQLEIDSARNELNEEKAKAEAEILKNENLIRDAETEIKIAKLQIESGKVEIEKAKAELAAGKQELEEAMDTYNQLMNPLKQQKDSLEQRLAELEASLDTMSPVQQVITQGVIDGLRKELKNTEDRIRQLFKTYIDEFEAAEEQILNAEETLATKEAEIIAAEQQIATKEKELAQGKIDLEKAKQELADKIQEGNDKLDDAEGEIAGIATPVWYVFDRSSIPEYTGYGDNADRIAALAVVFPSLFFLVAALISLTTMTRMVEEQRVQIGTLKALGYTNLAIAGKYVAYALLATVGGSLFGFLVGEKLFPYVIIMAYKILYTHIPHVLVPYHWGYGRIATLIAVACTGIATCTACYKELLSQPAVLMRPVAPQVGKRTWIEKIPFLWKRLNFTWKSSLRNLFRYKKRFFMTLFGIGGCMGLLVVGFGLRDSITSVATIQYERLQTYDASIYLSEEMDEETRKELETFLNQNKDVSLYTRVHMSSITTQNEEEEVDAYLTVVKDLQNAEQFFTFQNRVSKEKYTLSDEGVILSEKTAKMLGVKKGDTFVLSEEGMNPKQVKVEHICENYVGHYVYMTERLYQKIYGKETFGNNLLIKSGAEMEELEKLGEEILKFDHILNVQYTKTLSAKLNDMLGALDRVMIVLIIVAGMLSFVVLYNLNNINITERRRELATLKVLGFRDMEVATYVYRENILLTLLGVVVGCGLGKVLHLFTITTVEIDMAMFGREVSFMSFAICALFTVAFSALVNWMMFFKLRKINMVESLKSVE